MRANKFLLTTVLACLLSATLVAPVQAAFSDAPIVPPTEHTAAIENAEGDVYGSWERALEEVVLFLDGPVDESGDGTDFPQAPGVPPSGPPPLPARYMGGLRYDAPTETVPEDPNTMGATLTPDHPNDKRVLLDSVYGYGASFVLPDEMKPTRDYQIYGFEAVFYIGCPSHVDSDVPSGDLTVNIRARTLNDEGAVTGYHDYNGGTAGGDFLDNGAVVMPITGPVPSVSTGPVFEAETTEKAVLGNVIFGEGHRSEVFELGKEDIELRVAYSSNLPAGCYLHFGSTNFPSHIKLLTDTASVNTWIEDKDGEFTPGLPAADQSSQEQRRMTAKVAQASAWPGLNDLPGADDHSIQSRIWTGAQHPGITSTRQDDANDDRWYLQWRDLGDNGIEYSTRVGDNDQLNKHIKIIGDPTKPSVTRLADGLDMVEFDFLYTKDLADGRYQFEIFSGRSQMSTSTELAVGLKSFGMSLIDSRDAGTTVHEVERGEETTFLLSLRNFGAQPDNVQLTTTSPGTGWKLDLDLDRVQLPAAGRAVNDVGVEVPITVTPSPTAKVGDQARFTVTARSSFPEVADQSLELKVVVVDPETPSVAVFGIKTEESVAPGGKLRFSDLRVHNLGSRADAFLVEAKLPTDASGWTTRVLPPGKLIAADSVDTFTLEVNVAHDAPNGLTIELPVTVRLVGDNTVDGVLDTVIVTIHVILDHRLEFEVGENIVDIRTPTEECARPRALGNDLSEGCELDGKHDRSALYRLRFTNNGPVDEVYTLRGDWEGNSVNGVPVTTIDSSSTCDSNRVGGPEFWSLDYGKARDALLNNPTSGIRHKDPQVLESIVVPAGQTVYRWAEMGFDWPNKFSAPLLGCNTLSQAASYRFVATIDSAPGDKYVQTIGAYRVDQAAHRPVLEPALDPLTNLFTTDQESELISTTQKFEEVTYRFRVRSEANENDRMSVSVDPDNLFVKQRLEWVTDETPMRDTVCTSRTPQNWVCSNLGVNGEAVFDLVVEPQASTLSIDSPDLVHSIRAASSEGGTAASLVFKTDLVGEFKFDARAVTGGRDAHAGQVVHLPFQVLNQGSRDDTFHITLTDGSADWRPRLSTDDRVFVAGEHNLEGYLRVEVPATAQVDDTESFRLFITSSDPTKGAETLDFVVRVVEDAGMVVQGAGGQQQVLLEGRGKPQTIGVEAVDPQSEVGDPITFRVDRSKLPLGWSVEEPFRTGTVATDAQGHVASAQFVITAPQEAIGTSSLPLIVEACRGDQTECVSNEDFTASGDIILNLQDDVGVVLRLADPDVVTATLPGGDVVIPVLVQNAGLSPDVIDLSSTEAKTGWTISYDPPVLPLSPLESQVVDVIVSTPVDAAEGEKLDFILFATSRNEQSEFAQLQLSAEIGVFGLEWSTKEASAGLAPGESYSFVARVLNNGTLPDAVVGAPGLATPAAEEAYGDLVGVRLDPPSFELLPGEARDVIVSVRLSTSVPPSVTIPVQARFESIPDAPTVVTPTFDVKVLDYRAADVDRDGIKEFAVDRDGNKGNGFEEFLDPDPSAGTRTAPAQLVRFLSEEGRLRHTVKVTRDNQTFDQIVLHIDGDPGVRNFGDGKADLLLDSNGDGLPDLYWDPDDGHHGALDVFKDVNADGVPDYFVDTSGNGEFNAVYDLAQGTFLKLLVRDVDNDGTPDYVVDKNGNGRVDGDETVLFSREGKLIQVTKVDVDGDGKLDDVFDYDGDGVPDSFIPDGKTKGVPINVDRDLNEDGFLDWSYDANRDGRDDHFYDPAARTGGHAIDAQAEFVRSLQEFWYVGALFILVAALFVVLVAVTRR